MLLIGVLVLCTHLFIVYRAKQILNYIVLEASGGHYRVKSGKVRFHYLPLSIDAKSIEVLPVDAAHENTYYITTADSFSVRVTKLWSLLNKKNLSLENIRIIHPLIKVYELDTTAIQHKPLNRVIDELQHALVNTLADFSISNCRIDDAALSYVQIKKDRGPLHINHIWLNIENLRAVRHTETSDSIFSFEADVVLLINKPQVLLPNPNTTVSIDKLLLNTKQNTFTVSSLNLYNGNKQGTVDSINLSNVSLKKFNWNRWLREGIVEIDSLKASEGTTFFDFSQTQMFGKKNIQPVKQQPKTNINLLLHNVDVHTIRYGLRLGSPAGPFNIQLDGDSLDITDIAINNDSLRPIRVGSVAFKLSDFSNNYDSKKNASTFEKLIINHNNLQLVNFKRELNFKNIAKGSSITIPSLRLINFSLDDLLQYRLVADKLVLEKPSLVLDAQPSKQRRSADEQIANITAALRPSLSINKLSIRDAAIILLTSKKNNGRLTIEDLNTEIDAKQLLQSKSVLDVISSATALSSNGFRVTGPNINLQIQRPLLNSNKAGVTLQHVEGSIGEGILLNLNGININNTTSRIDISHLQEIPIDELLVNSGSITVDLTKKRANSGSAAKAPAFHIGSIATGPLHLNFLMKDTRIETDSAIISGTNILTAKNDASWSALNVNTGKINFTSGLFSGEAASVQIKEPGSIQASNLLINPHAGSSLNQIFIRGIFIQSAFKSFAGTKFESDKIIIDDPLVSIAKKDTSTGIKKTIGLPAILATKIEINRPSLIVKSENGANDLQVQTDSGNIYLDEFRTDTTSGKVLVKAIRGNLGHPSIHAANGVYQPEGVMFSLQQLIFDVGLKQVKATVDTALIRNMDLLVGDRNNFTIKNASAGVSGFNFSSTAKLTFNNFFQQANWWVNARSLQASFKRHNLAIYNPAAKARSIIGFDSLQLIPRISRDSFWNSFSYEKDYNTIKTGRTEINNWSLSDFSSGKKLLIQSMSADAINFLTERDKTRGSDSVPYRPLLARSFKKIPLQLAVDSMQITNSFVRHNLIPLKTKKEASIFFTAMNGSLYNVKNTNITESDTLRFKLAAKIMDQGDMLLGFRQSYTDSLQGFSLNGVMGRLDLTSLNRLLTPLLSIKIDRGIADSMRLLVGANDYVAYGSMDMRYHGLNVSLLINGERKYFLSGFFNWLINAFIPSKGDSKKNVVFQERIRSKSIFNYWSKIAINGLLSNIGIKRDKQQIRKYNKAVKRGDVPRVDTDLL